MSEKKIITEIVRPLPNTGNGERHIKEGALPISDQKIPMPPVKPPANPPAKK